MPREYRDLCCICIYVASCMNRGTTEKPKFYCEQFDLGVAGPPVMVSEDSYHLPGKKTLPGESRGLCSDCEERDHCTLSIPDGYVWHCEEYQ